MGQPDVVSQLRASDAKHPAVEDYIYEALRKQPILTVPCYRY